MNYRYCCKLYPSISEFVSNVQIQCTNTNVYDKSYFSYFMREYRKKNINFA